MWALALASGVYWGLKVFVKPQPAPAHAQAVAAAPMLQGDLSRLLGADPPPPPPEATPAEPPPDARFQLIGVVSPPSRQAAREGVALIAVDGKPAKAYRVGAVIEGTHVLQTVAARGVTIGPRNGPAVVALNLPPPAPPATGTLPDLGGDALNTRPELNPGVNPAFRGSAAPPRAVPPVMPVPNRMPGQPMPAPEGQENNEVVNQADTLPVR